MCFFNHLQPAGLGLIGSWIFGFRWWFICYLYGEVHFPNHPPLSSPYLIFIRVFTRLGNLGTRPEPFFGIDWVQPNQIRVGLVLVTDLDFWTRELNPMMWHLYILY